MPDITIELEGNKIRYLNHDEMEGVFSGERTTRRYSLVEFDNETQSWCVYDTDWNLLKSGFSRRTEAIQWEIDNLGPGSEYWNQRCKK